MTTDLTESNTNPGPDLLHHAAPDHDPIVLRISEDHLWNGARWVEVDRTALGESRYNDRYLDYLRKQLNYGVYTLADLDPSEQEQLGLDPNKNLDLRATDLN